MVATRDIYFEGEQYCIVPWAWLEADFYFVAVTFFLDKLFLPSSWPHKVRQAITQPVGGEGLEEGRQFNDGWSIFPDKRFHKVTDFSMRMGQNTSPICSRLARGQLRCNCHSWRKTFKYCWGTERETRAKYIQSHKAVLSVNRHKGPLMVNLVESIQNTASQAAKYKVTLWQLIYVFHFNNIIFHLYLILSKQRDKSQQVLCLQWEWGKRSV